MGIDLRNFGISNLQGSIYKGTFDDYDDLVANIPISSFGDTAVVENEQGANWKTFWIGGTYRPEGSYTWDGSEWSSNVKLISDELQVLNDNKADKVRSTAQSTNYTAIANDIVEMTTGASDKTVTLPPAASNVDAIIHVNKADSGSGKVIVDGNASELINGELTQAILSQHTSLHLYCNGTRWILI